MMKSNTQLHSHKLATLFIFLLLPLLLPISVVADCTCNVAKNGSRADKDRALKYKLVAIASILFAGGVGVCLPVLGKVVPVLRPERDVFFVIKAFAAGVILSTGFVHILPDAFDRLSSPCLPRAPWGEFPFTGLVAMLAAIGTLMVDTFATSYYEKAHLADYKKAATSHGQVVNRDEEVVAGREQEEEHAGHVPVHTHATNGHSHGSTELTLPEAFEVSTVELLRHRIISQVNFQSFIFVLRKMTASEILMETRQLLIVENYFQTCYLAYGIEDF